MSNKKIKLLENNNIFLNIKLYSDNQNKIHYL